MLLEDLGFRVLVFEGLFEFFFFWLAALTVPVYFGAPYAFLIKLSYLYIKKRLSMCEVVQLS